MMRWPAEAVAAVVTVAAVRPMQDVSTVACDTTLLAGPVRAIPSRVVQVIPVVRSRATLDGTILGAA